MSFMVKGDNVLVKYSKIWNKIKELTGRKLHNKPIYDSKYIKTKIKTLNNVNITYFHNEKIPKENTRYVCLAIITVDSIMKMNKKYCPYVYLGKCK